MSEPTESDTDILKALDETTKNRAWASKNHEQLRSKYQGKVFAIKNEQIVATKDDITELMDEVKAKGLNSALVLIESIPPKGVAYIL